MSTLDSFLAHINIVSATMFFTFVAITLFITWWAAKRISTRKDFYSAGGNITGLQNGLAIAGDYISAASFLGISGLVFTSGFDGLIYSIGFLVGWPIVLCLIAEPLRNLGRYNFSDALSYRFERRPLRIFAALSAMSTVILYLIAQMVGAGKLIEVLFGLPYSYALYIVGALMVAYVTFGGMIATTWVQLIKAVLLLFGTTLISILVMAHFGFSFEALFSAAVSKHSAGQAIMNPGKMVKDPVSAISLGLALMFGTAGLPHILMRFFTVRNNKEANRSVFYATGFIGYFYILTSIVGFGAIAYLSGNPDYTDKAGALIGGSNMAAIQLSKALGGDYLLGFISAVAFSTILAVVSGLTLAGASAISHDLYTNAFNGGVSDEKKELRISRIATVGLGIVAILLGILFEKQNVAYMVGLAFALAASTNFPLILLSIYWSKMTTRGALYGGVIGLVSTLTFMLLSKTIWVSILGNATAIFPYDYPALFSMPLAFIGIWFFSVTDKSARAKIDRDAYAAQLVRVHTGIGSDEHKGGH